MNKEQWINHYVDLISNAISLLESQDETKRLKNILAAALLIQYSPTEPSPAEIADFIRNNLSN